MFFGWFFFFSEYIGIGDILGYVWLYIRDVFARCGVLSVCECVCVLKARGSRAGVTFSRREAEMSRLVACGSWAAAAVCAWLALNLACLMRVEGRAHMVQRRAKVKRLQSHCKVRVVGNTERKSPPSLCLLDELCALRLHRAICSSFCGISAQGPLSSAISETPKLRICC